MNTRRAPSAQSTAHLRPALGIHLQGDRREVSAEALQKIVSSLLDLLKASSKALLAEGDEPLWIIKDLRLGSIATELEARSDCSELGEKLIDDLNCGLEQFLSEGHPPNSWSQDIVRAMHKVSQLQSIDGVTGVEFWFGDQEHSVNVDAEFDTIVESSLRAATSISMGSVTGYVVGWRDAGDYDELIVRDEATRVPVKVRTPAESGLTIQEFASARIQVWGELHRDRNGKKTSLELHGFEKLAEREPVSFEMIAGLWADDDERIDSVSFQRRLRDED